MRFVYLSLYSFYLVYLSLSFVLLDARSSSTPNHGAIQICPNFCRCDLYDKRNRAVCSAKRLINPNIDLPLEVESLDLSYNDITSLDNDCFKKYIYLVNLNISHNAIHTIDLFTFKTMRHISYIDLSFNRLEYFDESLFENNRKLMELHLEGNKFMGLADKPLLNSRSLRSLSLRRVQLDNMNTAMFSGLPSLEELDVSENLMITINLAAFEYLGRLKSVNMNQNLWNCDEKLMTTVQLLKERNIIVTLQDCREDNEGKGAGMFERMELVSSEENADFETEDVNVNVPTNWRHPGMENDYDADEYDEDGDGMMVAPSDESYLDSCADIAHAKLCRKYRQCLVNVSEILQAQELACSKRTASICYTEIDVKLVFLLGVAAGVSAAIFWFIVLLCLRICSKGFKKRKRKHAAVPQIDDAAVTELPTVPPLRMPHRLRRRQPQQRATYPHAAVARYDAVDDNFFSRLFGHRSRDRYYRSINQNTATLIRRLSRSNLFNNRLTQHIVDRELERGRNGGNSEPSSPNLEDLTADSHDDDEILSSETPVMQTGETETNRAETPPPNYVDVFGAERSESRN